MNSEEPSEGIVPVKYVFLDVVGFTHNRSVEAQSDLVRSLNAIVKASIEANDIPEDSKILIPTGDGICIALLNLDYLTGIESPYDAHLRIALDILKRLEEHNKTQDDDHRFQIRIGVNENVDNVIIDINENLNVAGDGINTAQRIMSIADGNQILVSSSVFNTLGIRDKYFKAFKALPRTKIKHGIELAIYQFISTDHVGVNIELPPRFRSPEKKESRLTPTVAYYLAHAIRNEKFFLTKADSGLAEYAGVVLLYVLATDSVEVSESTAFDVASLKAPEFGADFQSQFSYFDSLKFWVVSNLKDFIIETHLSEFYECFESGRYGVRNYTFINPYGKEKLKRERPEIWAEFALDANTA